jgi:hypothetical protein
LHAQSVLRRPCPHGASHNPCHPLGHPGFHCPPQLSYSLQLYGKIDVLKLASPACSISPIRAFPVPSHPSSATPLGPGSFLAVPSLLPMTTSVTRRPRVTFGPSPPSSPPIDLTASALLSHSPIPFDTSLHPLSSSTSSSSSPPSSSFYSVTIPAVSIWPFRLRLSRFSICGLQLQPSPRYPSFAPAGLLT